MASHEAENSIDKYRRAAQAPADGQLTLQLALRKFGANHKMELDANQLAAEIVHRHAPRRTRSSGPEERGHTWHIEQVKASA